MMIAPFDRMLWDVSKFCSPADWVPKHAIIKSPSEESPHDMLVERESMVGKSGLELALDPRQFIFVKFTNMLSFWFPFQQDGPVRRIAVYADKWNSGRAFDCIVCPPIFRDASKTICYNGGITHTFRVICKDRKYVAINTSAGHQVAVPSTRDTFETMAETFLAYVQSAALF